MSLRQMNVDKTFATVDMRGTYKDAKVSAESPVSPVYFKIRGWHVGINTKELVHGLGPQYQRI